MKTYEFDGLDGNLLNEDDLCVCDGCSGDPIEKEDPLIDTIRTAAGNIDWSARHLRLALDEGKLPNGTTEEVLSLAVSRINLAVDALFAEADALERWNGNS